MKQPTEHTRPLSSVQREIWFHQMLHPDVPLYNIGGYLRIRGPVDPVIFEKAIRRLLRENDALRAVIHKGDPLPTQEFPERVHFKLDFHDFSGDENPEKKAAAWMERRFVQPFTLYGEPLFDYALVKISGDDYRGLGRYHHIIMDGWGISLVTKRVAEAYDNVLAGDRPSSPKPSYLDFIDDDAAYLSSEKRAKHERYWLEKYRDLPDSLIPRRPHTRADKGPAPSRISHLWVDRTFYNRLGVLARENKSSTFHVFLGALYVYFLRTTEAKDFVIGLPILNRGSKAFKRTIGLFTGVLPARFRFGVDSTFKELVRSIAKELRADYRRQRFPIGEINKNLPVREQGRGQLFDITLSYEKHDYATRFNGCPAEPVSFLNGFDPNALALFIREFHEDQDVRIDFCYNSDAFTKAEIESLKNRFHFLMKEVVRDPGVLVRDIRIMPGEEHHKIVYELNDTARDYPVDKTIVDLFEERVEKTPDNTSFLFEDRAVSYAELNRRANRLAHHLIHLIADDAAASPPPADAPVIGLFIERGLEMIIGLLGILKAGAAYAPLDPEYPEERLAYMLEDSKASVLLTREKLKDALPGYKGRIICLDGDGSALEKQPDGNPAKRSGPDHPAYLIYTSGSTGKPKGVLGLHRGMVNRFHWMWETYPFEPGEICCQKTSLNFLDSLWEIFGPTLRGVPVVIAPDGAAKEPRRLAALLEAKKITRIVLVPSLLRVILEQLDEAGDAGDPLPDLKYWTSSGEALSPGLFNEFREKRPRDVLINLYGASETSADSVYFDSRRARSSECAPIGRPIANTRVYLLDERLQPVPMGLPGALYIGGVGLAHGYINRPGLTAEVFTPDPFAIDSTSRLYNSGDIARWLPDGALEYLGRGDYQVKIRGARVEINEIEHHLSRIPGVKNAAAAARDFDGDGGLELAAYLTSDQTLRVDSLRDHLGASLPDYMIPSYFIQVDAIPLTPSGKTDREALPAPSETIGAETTAPATPAEDLLATIWRAMLKRERVGALDNFFDLGGHSLLAARVISRIRDAFDVEIPLHVLFEHPTLKELAACIDNGRRGETPPPLIRAPENVSIPLSFAQQRLWFLDQLEGATATYNIPAALKLSGRLDVEALRQSLQALIQRHDSLRMRFPAKEGRACARRLDDYDPLETIDLQSPDPDRKQARVRRLAAGSARKPFDLGAGPLLRVSLLKTGALEHILLFNMHHIISDGWSMGILIRELGVLYGARVLERDARLPAPTIRYKDYAHWQRQWLTGETLQQQSDYWKRRLSGVPELLELPSDRPRPARQSHRGATLYQRIPIETTARLNRFGREQGATLYMTLLTAFNVLLHRYTGRGDICIGSPTANRRHGSCEDIIGFFVNTLVLRTRIEGAPDFVELLRQVRQTCLDAHAHQDIPFEHLVEQIRPGRSVSHAPLFQVMFVLQNAPLGALDLPGLRVSRMKQESAAAAFDLTVSVEESENGLECAWEYNTDLFNEDRVRRMAGHYRRLLTAVAEKPRQSVDLLPLLTAAEKQQQRQWNETNVDFPGERTIIDLFEQQAQKTPDAAAVVFEDRQWSYAELNRRVNQLAHYLMNLKVGHTDDAPLITGEALIGLFIERGPGMIVGLLGILKAGAAYLPLDPGYPEKRLAFMLEDSHALALLTSKKMMVRLTGHGARTICPDSDREAIEKQPGDNPARRSGPDDPAYVIYTSGSTGRPKGVMVEHRGVANLAMAQTRAFHVSGRSRVLQFASISFDAAVWEIVMALCNGASLHPGAPGKLLPDADLADLLKRRRITHITLPPSILEVLPRTELPDLATLIVAGEACPAGLVAEWSGNRRLFNAYGPTEYSVCATITECTNDGEKPSIGRPIANTRIHILDANLQPTPIGVPGELCISGAGLARGYLNRPDLTAERFIANPFSHEPGARLYKTGDLARWLPDGAIEYLGRADHQVKLRGCRIELGEIEACIIRHPAIREAVVDLREDGGRERLIAWFTTKDGADEHANHGEANYRRSRITARRITAKRITSEANYRRGRIISEANILAELRGRLRAELPDYMIPSDFVQLAAMPLTPNGKIDREALPVPGERGINGSSRGVPRDLTEMRLLRIWEKTLNIHPIGLDENFFDLGGHSILAVRMMSHIQQDFGRSPPLAALFQTPTIAQLAVLIAEQTDQRTWTSLAPIRAKGSRPPLFCLPGVGGDVMYFHPLTVHLGPDQPVYGLRTPGLDGKTAPHARIEDLAAHHIAMIKTVQPRGSYTLCGHSLGGFTAFEIARRLQKEGQEIALLAVFDSLAPGEEDKHRFHPADWDEAKWLEHLAMIIGAMLGKEIRVSAEVLRRIPADDQLPCLNEHLKKAGWIAPGADEARVRGLVRVFKANLMARYTPEAARLPRIVLFQAEDSVIDSDKPAWGWRARADHPVKVRRVPGDHFSMLAEPNVKILAEKLTECMESMWT